MKVNGKTIAGPNVEILYLPRGEDVLEFRLQAVLDYDDFDLLCPAPVPPVRLMKGGKKVSNPEDPAYKAAIDDYASKRTGWMLIKSISATEGIEFDTITLDNPNTWTNFDNELTSAGFSEIEKMRIVNSIMTANCLNDTKLNEARDTFLRLQQEQLIASSFQMDELNDTPSGEPASDSE